MTPSRQLPERKCSCRLTPPLRFCPDPMTTVFGKQADADLEVAERTGPTPVHRAGTSVVVQYHREVRRVTADQPVLVPTTFEFSGLVPPETEPLELAGQLWIPPESKKRCEL